MAPPAEARWWGLIGPRHSTGLGGLVVTPHDRSAVLDGNYAADGIELRGRERLVEYLRDPSNLHATVEFISHPVVVIGEGRSSQFDRGQSALLCQAAALLTLFWREPWDVRVPPIDAARLPPRVPESDPPPDPSLWAGPHPDSVPRALPAPFWDAWRSVAGSPKLRSSLTIWHQAYLAWPRHASLAFVGFCGVLEAFGSAADPAQQETSAQEGFSHALRRWSDAPVDSDAVRRLYGLRSKIAHGRRFPGLEEHASRLISIDLGTAGTATLDGDDADFALRVVGLVARASASALLDALVN